jgi:hypothetical protein
MSRLDLRASAFALVLAASAAPVFANLYTVTHTGDSGAGSLRWAIGQANGHAGGDQVTFNIPGSGVKVISLATPLPSLAAGTSIIGNTQPGYLGSPLIRLDGGDLAGNFWGLDTAGGNLSIQGLQIVRFNGPGLRIWHGGIVVKGNWIGNNGTIAMPNAGDGISCHGGNGLSVGGLGANDGNVLSGNDGKGLFIDDTCTGAVVWGNRIGTNTIGSAAIGNDDGIWVEGDGALIGGWSAGTTNVISGNRWNGIVVHDIATNTGIYGNRIGTNAAGAAAVGNAANGIHVRGDGNTIGSNAIGAANLVSGNGYSGVLIHDDASANVVVGNKIGTNFAGTAAVGNAGGGIYLGGDGNSIGSSALGGGNLVSGNAYDGLFINENAAGNVVLGNRIGTNLDGSAAVGNTGAGIDLRGDGNSIGSTSNGAGNLISGNGNHGLVVFDTASGNVIRANRIGTDAAGAAAIANAGEGIALHGTDNEIGGEIDAARNLLSGNAYDGIGIYGGAVSGNQIVNNRIGTNAAGTSAIPNAGYGIRALEGGEHSIRRNLISGNGRAFSLEGGTHDFVVQANVIGLNATQTAELPNHSTGLDIAGWGHLVGGTAAGEGNVIAGNEYSGVWITGPSATGNRLEGNFIGTNAAGAAGLGNTQVGVIVTEASGNTIGGVSPGAGNTIAWNGYLGVYVWSGEGNAILGNSIHDNVLLGIDLEPQGPVANDQGDWDAGPNRGQNYPVVTSALAAGADLEIEGVLDARPSTEYRIELFSSATFDTTGVGEGENFLGAIDVLTGADGHTAFATTLAAAGGEQFVTATATSPELDTSEFSPAIAIGAPQPGKLQIWRDVLLSYEGTPGLEVSIVRSHGVAGTVSVDVATLEDSAISPEDFGALDSTLTFAPGEVVKTVFVPIVTDGQAESDEKWRLALASPTGGATLGVNQNVLAWLFDATLEWPMYSIGDVTIVEGDAGQKNATFVVTLTATDHVVPIEWWTSDGGAAAGEDYVGSTGLIQFAPGQTSKTITVPILGDATVEPDESFYVHLYATGQAIVWDGLADARILDDDGGSDNFIFADGFEAGNAQAWSSIVGNP